MLASYSLYLVVGIEKNNSEIYQVILVIKFDQRRGHVEMGEALALKRAVGTVCVYCYCNLLEK